MTRYILPVLFFLFLAGATYVIKERRAGLVAEAAPSHAAAAPATAREAWAVAFLAALGNAQPTPATVAMVVAWTLAEDSGDGAFERNNPLNTTICGHNFVGAINSDGACGVGHYATYQDGVSAAVDTITQANFSAIVAALQANDADGAKQALWASPWAESHYGYGSAWPVYRVASPPVAPLCPLDPCWQSGTGYGEGHPGIDLGASEGQLVFAVLDGTAALSSTWPCGNGVLITAGSRQVLMCHLSTFTVADGAPVRAGDVVAHAGSTGQSTGPHVHFELREDGASIDPRDILSGALT